MKRAGGNRFDPTAQVARAEMAMCIAGQPNKWPTMGNPCVHPHICRRTPSFIEYRATLRNTVTPEKSVALRTLENVAFTMGRPLLYPAFAGTATSGMGGYAGHPKLATTEVRS